MRRPSAFLTSSQRRWDVSMTPMIDVVFLLLVFFVWTASFQIVEYQLPGYLASRQAAAGPAAQPDPSQLDFDSVVIKIGWQEGKPHWSLNGRTFASLALIQAPLAKIVVIKSDLPVIIDPAAEMPLKHVIRAYDAGRSIGFSDIRFATPDS